METSTRFFSGKNIKIELGEMGVLLNVTTPDNEVYLNVEPRRYFPISDIYKYISIVRPAVEKEKGKDKEKENELFIIKDMNLLDDDSKKNLLVALDRFYMIPKIKDVVDSKSIYGILQWETITDRGRINFDIRDSYSSIKQLPDGRILVIDTYDNRYEIPDYTTLSRKAQKLLLGYM